MEAVRGELAGSLSCEITLEDAERAIKLSNFLIRRFLLLADEMIVASQDIDAMKTMIKKMPARGKKIKHSALLKAVKMTSNDFGRIMKTMLERGDILKEQEGRSAFYICPLTASERKRLFSSD